MKGIQELNKTLYHNNRIEGDRVDINSELTIDNKILDIFPCKVELVNESMKKETSCRKQLQYKRYNLADIIRQKCWEK